MGDEPKLTAAEIVERKLRELEARKKPELHAHKAPDGYRLKGVSTLLDGDGNVKAQWVKTTKEADDANAILDAFTAAVAERDIPPAPLVPPPASSESDILAVYPFGDPHIGMLSWHLETGTDFDLRIATANLTTAVRQLVSLAPPARECLLINLGDFFHADNLEAVTKRSGHALDTDSRWPKILRVGIECFAACIEAALEKHETVHVICEIGNHDDHTSMMLAICMSVYFRDNPRVRVDTSPNTFHWHEFGKNLIGTTHGHNTKPDQLAGIMAADKPQEWGRTEHRYWYTGHVHHETKKEVPGVIVESFRTMAPRDAWHNSKGYRAGRSMVCDVLHREYGRILRHEVGIARLGKP